MNTNSTFDNPINRVTEDVLETYLFNMKECLHLGFSYGEAKSLSMDAVRTIHNIVGPLTGAEFAKLGRFMKGYKEELAPGSRKPQQKIVVTPKSKICPRCKKNKLIAEFSLCKDKRDGHQSWCRQCVNERRKQIKIMKQSTTPTTKRCPRCNKEKPFTDFSELSYPKNALKSWCKQCTNEYSEAYRQRKATATDDSQEVIIKNLGMTFTKDNLQVVYLNNEFRYSVGNQPFTDAELDGLFALRAFAKSKIGEINGKS